MDIARAAIIGAAAGALTFTAAYATIVAILATVDRAHDDRDPHDVAADDLIARWTHPAGTSTPPAPRPPRVIR